LPFVYWLATLATLGKVLPTLDRLEQAFVKQSVKPKLPHSTKHLVKRLFADSSAIVRIPLSPPSNFRADFAASGGFGHGCGIEFGQ
jgi:hypothetical protein